MGTEIELEHTKLINLHANGEPLMKWSLSHSHSFPVCKDSACCHVCKQQSVSGVSSGRSSL